MPVKLEAKDLNKLEEWFPRLKFNRDDQINALLHMESADFQAVPGSGKTTLLGAKIALIARKWQHTNRGVCIVSHTNVAKQEIERRLLSIPGGEAFLAYPHYIGTIQTFVNKYLAIPWLRERGIELKEIDDDAYGERILILAKKHNDIRGWLFQNEWDRATAIRGIRYNGAELTLATWPDSELPKNGKTITALRDVKKNLTQDGWFRYDDMFAFAERALKYVPTLHEVIAHRFPLVFIDEMQDTNDLQLDVLSKVFAAGTVVQRFGDNNQAILNRGAGKHAHAFPKQGFFEISSSLRFGPEIADVANRLKLVGGNIEGSGSDAVAKPAFILYSTATIESVVQRFGQWAAENFTLEELGSSPIKAVCGVKREGNAQQPVGRHIRDYAPDFVIDANRPAGARATLCRLVREASAVEYLAGATAKRISAARLVVLKLLQHCGRPELRKIADWPQLRRSLQQYPKALQDTNHVVLDILEGQYVTDTQEHWSASLARLMMALEHLLELGAKVPDVDETKYEADIRARPVAHPGGVNTMRIDWHGKSFDLHLSTIASVKGETHLATLVLESCFKRHYDLSELIPYLTGQQAASQVKDPQRRSQLHNLFVAVTRATRMTAIAVHTDRVQPASIPILRTAGWGIWDWRK